MLPSESNILFTFQLDLLSSLQISSFSILVATHVYSTRHSCDPPPSPLCVIFLTKKAFDPLINQYLVPLGRPNPNSPPEDFLGLSMRSLTTHRSMLLLLANILYLFIFS